MDKDMEEIFCEECKRSYKPQKIIIKDSPGISSSTIRKLKKFLKKETGSTVKNIPLPHGKQYCCPEGHLLEFKKTFIT